MSGIPVNFHMIVRIIFSALLRPSDNDIELIELDDFYKNASEELRQANLSDPHQLYLARLKHELSERKRFSLIF
jgi:hypothetical protein